MIFDDIFKEIGDFGKGQIIQYFLLCLPSLFGGFLSVDIVFLTAVPDFVCKPNNLTLQKLLDFYKSTSLEQLTDTLITLQKNSGNYLETRCHSWNNLTLLINITSASNWTNNDKCTDGFLYSKSNLGNTLATEFNLLCDRDYIRMNLKETFFFGCIFGAFISGQISDLIGRLLTFIIIVILNVITGLGLFLSTSPMMVSVFFFIQGFTYLGYSITTFTLGIEMVGPSKRKWTGTIFNFFYTAGFILVPIVNYYLQNWRYLALLSGLPSVIFLTYYFYVYESPRWLLTKGRVIAALNILVKVASTNKIEFSEKMKQNILNHNKSKEYIKDSQTKHSLFDLIKTKPMLFMSLNMWYFWAVNSLIYFGIVYNSENLSGSLYINLILMGMIEIPAYCLNIVFVDTLGRKGLLITSSWVTGLVCLITGTIPPNYSKLICAAAIIGKFSITVSFGILFFFTAEIFPTVVRNSAMGICAMSARVGALLAVPILSFQKVFPPLPMITFAVLAFSVGGLMFLLPETKGKPLDQPYNRKIKIEINRSTVATEELKIIAS